MWPLGKLSHDVQQLGELCTMATLKLGGNLCIGEGTVEGEKALRPQLIAHTKFGVRQP